MKNNSRLFSIGLMLAVVASLGAAPAFVRGTAVRAQDFPPTPTAQATETPLGPAPSLDSPAAPVGAQPSTSASSSSPGLPEPAQSSSDQPPPTDQIIIKYKTGSPSRALPMQAQQNQRLSAAARTALEFVRPMSGDANVLRLPGRLPVDQVQAIADQLMTLPEVEYAEPDHILLPVLTPSDPQYPSQWDMSGAWGISAPAAWDISMGDSSIVVADIDTGITNHAEFTGRIVPGYDFISNVAIANDGGGRDANPSDPGDWITHDENLSGFFAGCGESPSSWHGTHTAGTIGASANNSIGVAGINWNSKILPVRVLGKCGNYDSDIADGMRWAAGLPVSGVPNNPNPAKVMNVSLGGLAISCSTTFQTAITAITAAGAVVVAAAGNDNQNASGFEPANCTGVITVAASASNGSKSSYSNWGSTVEISAPGDSVLSTWNTGAQGPGSDTYATANGTSMATPHVTGVVSLMFSVNPSLTPAQVLAILQSTAKPYPNGTCTSCGGGILDAGAAVAAACTPDCVSVNVNAAHQGSYVITSGGQAHPIYAGVFDGAVRVVSGNATNIFASERQIFGSSFSESMGIPANRLTTEYYFPWYDGYTMHTWITIGAPSSNVGNANAQVYIGTSGIPVGTYSVAPGSQVHPDYPGMFDGAVRVVCVSCGTNRIFASERQIYGSSFSETMGIPSNQLSTEYWFPLYDAVTMRTWISIGAPSTNVGDTTVHVYMGNSVIPTGTYTVAPGGFANPIYTGTLDGPVHVVGTQDIFVSERQIYGGSFSESLGVPFTDLTTQYYFPWYDGLTMSTALSFGAPDSNSGNANVDVYVAGVHKSSFSMSPGTKFATSYPGLFNGSVFVSSTKNVFVSERQIYGGSFAETMAIPATQLFTDYWFPWYDGWTMRTWVSIGKP